MRLSKDSDFRAYLELINLLEDDWDLTREEAETSLSNYCSFNETTISEILSNEIDESECCGCKECSCHEDEDEDDCEDEDEDEVLIEPEVGKITSNRRLSIPKKFIEAIQDYSYIEDLDKINVWYHDGENKMTIGDDYSFVNDPVWEEGNEGHMHQYIPNKNGVFQFSVERETGLDVGDKYTIEFDSDNGYIVVTW